MSVSAPESDRYSFDRVIRFVQACEDVYGVSIDFSLVLRRRVGAPGRIFVRVWGCGEYFDHLPGAAGGAEVEVYSEQPFGLGEALYLATLTLVQRFDKLRGSSSTRPSL